MDRTKLSPEHALFARFVGDWVGDERVAASDFGPASTARARLSFRIVADGMFLAFDYVEDGGLGIVGHGVIGFDPKRALYTLHWFDNAGGGAPPSTIGTCVARGNELAFEGEYGTHIGRTIFVGGDNEMRMRVEMQKPDAANVVLVDATLAKIDDASTIEQARASSTLRSHGG